MKPSNQAVAAERPAMLLPMLALALSVVGIASAPILVRVSEVDPTATLMLRMVFAGAIVATVPILGPWRAEDAKTSWSRGKTVAAVVVSGLIFTLDLLANHWAVVLTSVANTTLLMNTTPIFALVIAAIFFGEVISRQKLISIAVAIVGGAMLVGESIYLEASLTNMAGDMLAVASAVLYATYLNMTKGLRGHLSGRTVTFFNSAVCAAALFPVVLLTSGSALPATGWGYATVIGLAVISQILGHGMMAYALKHVEAGLASMTSLIRPGVSVFLAWLFLAEPLSLLQAAGGGLILLAIYFFNR